MSTLVVLQPGYLPWLGYFDLMHRADVFVHYDDVQYDKHGWRNRNRVKGARGAAWLSVPVRHRSRFGQSLLEAEIVNGQHWKRKHIATIRQLYARAPFLSTILPGLEQILQKPWSRLVDLNLATITWLAAELGVATTCHRASVLGIGGARNERLLALCRHFGATRYLTGDAARDYLDVDLFKAAGVEVAWHCYAHPRYPQLHGPFASHLSALDLLLNVGRDSLAALSCAEPAERAPGVAAMPSGTH